MFWERSGKKIRYGPNWPQLAPLRGRMGTKSQSFINLSWSYTLLEIKIESKLEYGVFNLLPYELASLTLFQARFGLSLPDQTGQILPTYIFKHINPLRDKEPTKPSFGLIIY